jgi:DNA-binding NtrC family response regulator
LLPAPSSKFRASQGQFFSISCSSTSPHTPTPNYSGTFAVDGPSGKLELANGGRFLDEIADLSLLAQSRLYRVLEEKMSSHSKAAKAQSMSV